MFAFTVELFQSFQHGVELGPCWMGCLTSLPGFGAVTAADVCWGSVWMLPQSKTGRRIGGTLVTGDQSWSSGFSRWEQKQHNAAQHEEAETQGAILSGWGFNVKPCLQEFIPLGSHVNKPFSFFMFYIHLHSWHPDCTNHCKIKSCSMAQTLGSCHFPSSIQFFPMLFKWTVLLQE